MFIVHDKIKGYCQHLLYQSIKCVLQLESLHKFMLLHSYITIQFYGCDPKHKFLWVDWMKTMAELRGRQGPWSPSNWIFFKESFTWPPLWSWTIRGVSSYLIFPWFTFIYHFSLQNLLWNNCYSNFKIHFLYFQYIVLSFEHIFLTFQYAFSFYLTFY